MFVGAMLAMPKYEIKLIDNFGSKGIGLNLGEFEGETASHAIKKAQKQYKNLINERSKLEVKEVK